jgi:hypothetical protein
VIAKLRALWDTKKIHKGGMLIVLLLAPIRSASAAKSVLQASATTDTDLKSRIVKVQTTLVAGPRNQPRRVVSTPTWYVLEQIQPRI